MHDGLSRGKTGTEVGLPPDKAVDLRMHPEVAQYIALCDPTKEDLPAERYMELAAFLDLLERIGADV